MRIVLASGCFDVFHSGHVEHLQQARAMGDMLVVALTSDENVNKGPDRPVNNWSQRAAVLKECRSVDLVIKSPNSVDAIRLMRPQIFVKGIDYADGGFTENIEEACKEVGAELKFTTSKKRSSTEILGKL